MRAKQGKYTMADIAEYAEMDPMVVYRHRKEGKFDFENLESVANYILSLKMAQMARIRDHG